MDERLVNLFSILKKSSYPIAYDHFLTPQSLPYLIFLATGQKYEPADGINYYNSINVQIELYTQLKLTDAETTVESILSNAGYYFQKSEGYLSDERMYMVTYNITI